MTHIDAMGRGRMKPDLAQLDAGARLNALLATYDRAGHVQRDPISFVHASTRDEDREVVGLLASSLAFGNVKAVRRSIVRVLEVLGPHPASAIETTSERALARKLRGFVHRTWTGVDIARLLARAAQLRRSEGSLGSAFATRLDDAGALREGLARFADALRGPTESRSLRHLVPDPRAGSACKRLILYLRWMVRPADGIDLGLWPVDPSRLIVPVDTHIQRIAHNLGLTTRTDASWRTAEEITASLRVFDPNDPVKYDFALCHLGISRACPSRRDPALCAQCVLRDACRHWRTPTRLPRRDRAARGETLARAERCPQAGAPPRRREAPRPRG
jgi:uncharacterized protein (TIGR02757 family)